MHKCCDAQQINVMALSNGQHGIILTSGHGVCKERHGSVSSNTAIACQLMCSLVHVQLLMMRYDYDAAKQL